MKLSDYHLLQLVRCLSYLSNQDEHVAETIIKRNDVRRINGMSARLAYNLNVSEHGLRLVRHGNLDPIAKILWSCSQCVNDVPSLERYLRANREVSFTSPSQMMRGTGLSFSDFKLMLLEHKQIPVRTLRHIAVNIHAPKRTLIRTFIRSGLKVFDPIKDLPVLAKHVEPRISLKNYVKSLAYAHQKSMKWLAGQLGYKYSKLISVIKKAPESKVVYILRKLPNIFQGVSLHVVTEILHDNERPQLDLMKNALRQIHGRKSLMKFIILSAQLRSVALNDLAKALGKSSNSLRTFSMECSSVQLIDLIIKTTHILDLPRYLSMKILKVTKSVANRIPLPKRLLFDIDYFQLPFGYKDNYSAKIRQSALDSKYTDLRNALPVNDKKRTRRDIRIILGIWSKQFGFSETEFLKQNFNIERHGIDLYQSNRNYPIHSYDWGRILTSVYHQLSLIHDTRNPSLLSVQIARRIQVDGDSIRNAVTLGKIAEGLMNHQEHIFTGKFSHTGVRTILTNDSKRKEYYRPIVVFTNIHSNHKLILDRAVFNYTKIFVNLGHLHPGDLIKTKAMVCQDDNGYNLNRPNWVKLIRRSHQRNDEPVPSEIHALTGFAIENNQSGYYDFTTWGHNYGYVRYCKQQYKLWKQRQKGVSKHA